MFKYVFLPMFTLCEPLRVHVLGLLEQNTVIVIIYEF